MIRLLAIDVDGTLLDGQGRVPDANREAVAEAAARGIDIVLVTGRAYHFVAPIARALPCRVTVVASNGALVKDASGRSEHRVALPRAVAAAVLGGTRPWRDDAGVVFDREGPAQIVFERTDWSDPRRQAYFERNRVFIAHIAPLEQALVEDPIAVVYNGPVARMRALRAALAALEVSRDVTVTATEYEARDFGLVDVLASGCDKGTALAGLSERRGVARTDVMAVGDNLNDVGMLEFAGRPVVMGNAVAELHRRGWPVTGGHDAAGLAAAIRTFALGES